MTAPPPARELPPDRSIVPWALRAWIAGSLGTKTADRIEALARNDEDRSLQSALIEVVAVGLDKVERQRAEDAARRAGVHA